MHMITAGIAASLTPNSVERTPRAKAEYDRDRGGWETTVANGFESTPSA